MYCLFRGIIFIEKVSCKDVFIIRSSVPISSLLPDFIDFVKLCNKYEVEYLVIGGYAVSIHGYPRSTKDLDMCIKVSEENALKMVQVINEFGFASLKLTKEDFLKRDFITQLGHDPVRIDILNDLDNVPFEQAWLNKKIIILTHDK